MRKTPALLLFCAVWSLAAVSVSEVVSLPSATTWGGEDTVGSQLIGRTYNGGDGPGIWIVADGGYRLYLNGELLAEDNQAGRVTFVPMTFLPGANAVSVVGVDTNGTPGVLVQIDELDTSYVSGSNWKVSTSVSSSTWKNKTYSDTSSWASATADGSASTTPSGAALSGFATGSSAKWIWAADNSASQAVLRFVFYIKPIGFGAETTGGEDGTVVVLSDTASIVAAMQDATTKTILIPEGTYDFRIFRYAVPEATANSRTWCKKACESSDANSSNTMYRINFSANSCSGIDGTTIVPASDSLKIWGRWITTKPNKSLIGMGRGAYLRGASFNMRIAEGAKNQIYRNLAIYDVNPHLVEASDGLTIVGESDDRTGKFWADHISYKWISDGMDLEYTTETTVSWLDYDGRNEYNCWATDPYVALVEDAEVTYANDYWHATMGRVPKVVSNANSSTVHIFNSYVDTNTYFIAGVKGTSSSVTSEILYENNYVNHAFAWLSDKDSYGYIDWTGNTVANSSSAVYYNATTSTSSTTAPTDDVFSPSYSYTKRTVSTLPTVIPQYAGVGGPYGAMPEYDRPMGQSNQAPTVSLTSPTDGATSTGAFTLTATASDSDGSIKSVAFYIGNTLVGTATASPYSVSVSGLASGTYSIVAVATDDSSLTRTSDFVTVTVNSTDPAISYVDGDTNQIVLLGDSIEAISYTYINSASAAASGLPDGVSATLSASDSSLVLSGAPTAAGTYTFSVYTVGGTGTADSLTGTFLVVAKVSTVSTPASILSLVNAAYPHEGEGAYEEKNDGWIDSGYYNFTNSSTSYGLWKLKATTAASPATLVIRFANGGTEARHMSLTWNDTVLGAVPFASTSAWTTWDSVSLSADLVEGLNTLQLNSIGSEGGPNVDEFEFDVDGVSLWNDSTDTATTAIASPGKNVGAASYDPVRGVLFTPMSGLVQLRVYDLHGNRVAYREEKVSAGVSSLSIASNSLPKGIYWIEIRLNGQRSSAERMVKLQ